MHDKALEAREDQKWQLSCLEQGARDIAESSLFREEWNRIAKLAQTVPTMPIVLRVCMDHPAGSHHRWQNAPLFQFYEDRAIMAAVELEATRPKYFPLPAPLARFEQHPLYEAGRPLGRCLYRSLMYFEDEETDEEVYYPVVLEPQDVVAFVDGTICPKDKRLAVAVPLELRVGRVVGFLSGLAVSQPHEAQGGMAILVALVQPLLSTLPPERPLNRAARRAAARKKLPPAH